MIQFCSLLFVVTHYDLAAIRRYFLFPDCYYYHYLALLCTNLASVPFLSYSRKFTCTTGGGVGGVTPKQIKLLVWCCEAVGAGNIMDKYKQYIGNTWTLVNNKNIVIRYLRYSCFRGHVFRADYRS